MLRVPLTTEGSVLLNNKGKRKRKRPLGYKTCCTRSRKPDPPWLAMASFREEPKPGDLIEISRIGYSHWALYVGGGYVIHLAPPDEYPGAGSSSVFSVLSSRGVVKRELLSAVVGSCHYQVNNHLDSEYSPLPVNKIIRSAEEMVGKELAYSVLNRNCEHFVTDLRYGKARSRQAEKFKTGATVGLGALAATLLTFTIASKRSQRQ